MKLEHNHMNALLNAMLLPDEQNLCPVYAAFKDTGFWASPALIHPAYVTVTNFNRLLITRYYMLSNDFSREIYILDTAEKLRVKKSMLKQYSVEAAFIVDGKKECLKFQISPSVVGCNFPDQKLNAQMLISLLETFEK